MLIFLLQYCLNKSFVLLSLSLAYARQRLLRFGHGSEMTSHRDVIHSLAAASLPHQMELKS